MAALEPTYLESPAQISGLELRAAQWGAAQEGAWDSGDQKVSAGAGTREVTVAVGVVYVQGDSVTDQGMYRCRNDAVISSNTSTAGSFEVGGIPPADATNPRIDQIVARVYDASHDASGQRKWRPEVIAGTATAGATLDNRNGAAALPGGAVRLADVLIPAGATTVIAGNIRDRRPWARGAYFRIESQGADLTTTSSSFVAIDSTNLSARIECSGVPLRVELRAPQQGASLINTFAVYQPRVDAATVLGTEGEAYGGLPANYAAPINPSWDFVPAAGSHVIAPYWRVTGGATAVAQRGADIPVVLSFMEIVRQNAQNV